MWFVRKTKVLCIVSIVMLGFMSLVPFSTTVYANEVLEEQRNIYNQVDESAVIHFFEQLEQVPDAMLLANNDEQLNHYLARSGNSVRVGSETPIHSIQKRGWWECSLAVGVLMTTTAIPAAKILRVKRLIRSLGGGVKAAKLIFGASLSGKKWVRLGRIAQDLILELVGITSVKKACF